MSRDSRNDDTIRMNTCAADAERAGHLIAKAFVWDATDEGHGYWEDVAMRLRDIANTYQEK